MDIKTDYKYALEQSSIISITNANGIINYVNAKFCAISKYSAEDLIGQDHRIENSGYHSKFFFNELWTTITNGRIWKGDIKNKAKDGTYYWVDTTIVPLFDKYGKPYQYISIRSDITDRKKGEEELKRTLNEISSYKYALDESAIVAITDHRGIITHVNDNFCRISKYTTEELIGQDHKIVNSGFHSKEYIRDLWQTIAKGHVWKGELKNKAKDGSTYWVDSTIVPFLNNAGKPYQYLAIRSNITERKIAEKQFQESNMKAVEYAKILEAKNIQLEDFCNIVSHNLRAPLVNITMLVDYIEQCEHDMERMELISKIKPVANHLMDILNELVESIQVKNDIGIQSDAIETKECIDKILRGFETQIKECNADIQIDLGGVPIIYFPKKYMESILTNLLSNALKFRSPNKRPQITIKTEMKTNNVILLSVSDNGLGIDLVLHKDQIFKIRKTFHKHPEAKGFGLFMTKTQVEAMNGKLWVKSQPGIGSTFYVEFKSQLISR